MPADLEGVVATSTRLSHVDGEAGRLIIAGYAVEDLAPNAGFEEVAYLLLKGRLPEPAELVRFTEELSGRRALSPAVVEVPERDALRFASDGTIDHALNLAALLLAAAAGKIPLEPAKASER